MNRVMPSVALPVLAFAIAGCATASSGTADAGGTAAPAECDETMTAEYIGQRATPEIGARLLQITGARTLRWAPPNSALTMDFRPDRLTVSYDQNYVIDRIACG